MIQVQFNNSNENPFYGLRNCLALFQNSGKVITNEMLNLAWNEVKDDKEKKEMFFSLLFSIGDITARHHNLFADSKRDSGGNANREAFYVAFEWLKENHFNQFVKFLNAGLFNEYTCFDLLFKSRVQTKGNKVLKVFDIFSVASYRKALAEYIYAVVNGTNAFNKHLVAKFLTIPRMSKRSGHKKMLPETKRVMENKSKFLMELSNLVGWEYENHIGWIDFVGYKRWRKTYNGELESVLFSTGEILKYDREQFLTWFDRLPAQARFRVKNRILYSKTADDEQKWTGLKAWYEEWEKYKTQKQAEQRVLEEKVRQGQASIEDKEKLEKVKKQAKVNVGATNFSELYKDICSGRIDELKIESFMNKVNLPYNSLVIIDDSGSMSGAPFNFASFMASVCLVKNPDDDARNLIGFFNNYSHWYTYIDSQAKDTPNSLFRRTISQISPKPLVDPTKSFMDNYRDIHSFCVSKFMSGGTNISSIPEGLNTYCQQNPQVLDALKSYPIWTIVSDGYFNQLSSPEASMNDFMRRCENYFGFRPFIIVIDVINSAYANNAERFRGIDNMIYIPGNPAMIEQVLTNFKDMDRFDTYTPLQSLHRSNRYMEVRENVL